MALAQQEPEKAVNLIRNWITSDKERIMRRKKNPFHHPTLTAPRKRHLSSVHGEEFTATSSGSWTTPK
jgi:hypothetical protein